jgi:hypothetical protein
MCTFGYIGRNCELSKYYQQFCFVILESHVGLDRMCYRNVCIVTLGDHYHHSLAIKNDAGSASLVAVAAGERIFEIWVVATLIFLLLTFFL